MVMYAIVIGASDEAIYAIKKAQSKGISVLAFDGNADTEGLKYADESFVVDIRNPQNIIDIIDKKHISSDEMFVLPVPIGRYLISTGAFNEHYGLIGAKLRTTEICTDKWLFHETMLKEGLRNISCSLLKKGDKALVPHQYPVIVKPRYGAGSREVLRISNIEEWKQFEKSLPFDEDFVIEDAVEGCEYGIDGMVIDEKFTLVFTRKKLMTKPPYRQCVGYISIKRDDERNAILEKYLKKLVSAIGLKDGIIHADIIMDSDEPFIIEMSARPSGHRLHDLFTPMVTGVDMISDFIDYALGEKKANCVNHTDKTYIIRYFDMGSEVKRIPDKEFMMKKYNLLEYECNLTVGEKITIKDGHSLMGRGFYILCDDSEEEAINKANRVLEEYV